MASALTGNKIKDSYQALLKMGTNGSLDPTTLITISDGLGNDTPLQLAGDKLATDYLGDNKGLFMDFVNDDYQFGELFGGTAYLSIGINGSLLFGNNVTSLESNNKQVITNNGVDQYIITGDINGFKGFNLDFANNQYQFGDYNGINYFGQLIIRNGASELLSDNNNLGLFGPSLNTVLGYLPGSININDPSANSNNYVFGSDWLMDNNDDTSYPFKYNTVLNCYNNGLDTSDKAISYSLFANIQDPGFELADDITLLDGKILSNCFIFGLTDYVGSNTLKVFTKGSTPTNVVVFNGSDLFINNDSTSIFSVNATSLSIDQKNSSGINIIGGDFSYDGNFYATNHRVPFDQSLGITLQGRYAFAGNNFAYVKAEYFNDWGTQRGQVQVEELQLFNHWDDGTVESPLLNTQGNEEIFLQNSSTYTVELKLVSTTGNGDKGTTGNSYINLTWKVCVNSSGTISIAEPCQACSDNPGGATAIKIYNPNNNLIYFGVRADTDNGNECWAKGYVTLSCVTTN
jgi:hypothetical protein